MKTRTRRRFESMPLEAREQFAENTKERIYSTITLLAVITALWHSADHHSHAGVLATIVGSVVALWLATLMSARMSYRAVHGKSVPLAKYREAIFAASGLLAPAAAPVLFVLLSAFGVITLKAALFVSMVALLLSMFIFSIIGSRRIYNSPLRILTISLLELSIGLGVVALKLLAGE